MHRQTLLVTLGCLWHDIGKMACRAAVAGHHSATGAVWLRQAGLALPPEVLDGVARHHDPAPAGLAALVRAADCIVTESGAANPSHDDEAPLAPIFIRLNGDHGGRWVEPLPQDGTLRLPRTETPRLTADVYRHLLQGLAAALRGTAPDAVDPQLSALARYTGSVPAVATAQPVQDLSLFDHLKITAAVGACLSEDRLAAEQTGVTDALLQDETALRRQKAFLLYSADFSGVQKFIYTVAVQGALRSLRSRSFFLEFAMEHYLDELLRACGVSRANLLYSGGGHCYLLLPNTPAVRQAADGWNTRFNEWLFAQFGTRLFLAHGYTACTADDLTNTPAEQAPYKAMFRRVSAAVAAHKMHRVTAAQLHRLNQAPAEDTGRECAVCGRSDALVLGQTRCAWCTLFETISPKIQTGAALWVGTASGTARDFTLPTADGEAGVAFLSEAQARARLDAGETPRHLYLKNAVSARLPDATTLLVGDYAAANQMEALSQTARGIRRLAVCRMDVDNLGQAFVAGFERPQDPDPARRTRYVTLSRTAAFSRQMSLFFKQSINSLLDGRAEGQPPLQVTVVYSGGDDVFLVGAWDDTIAAALRIRQALTAFTCGALTISAGIGLFDDHFPIRTAALQTAELEDAAKSLPEKNAVALFGGGTENAYGWDTFVNQVQAGKLAALEAFFGSGTADRGNTMLYNMLALLRAARQDRVPLARYAYLLARLAPPRQAPNFGQYERFSRQMYAWALTPEDRRQLITAISLYLYGHRKGS